MEVHAESIEAHAQAAIPAQISLQDISGERISLNNYRLKGMINPLPKADEKTANGKQIKDSRDDNQQSPYASKKIAAYERLLSISSDKSISRKPMTRQEVQELKEIWEDLSDFDDPVVRLYRWVLSKISNKRKVSAPGEKD